MPTGEFIQVQVSSEGCLTFKTFYWPLVFHLRERGPLPRHPGSLRSALTSCGCWYCEARTRKARWAWKALCTISAWEQSRRWQLQCSSSLPPKKSPPDSVIPPARDIPVIKQSIHPHKACPQRLIAANTCKQAECRSPMDAMEPHKQTRLSTKKTRWTDCAAAQMKLENIMLREGSLPQKGAFVWSHL